MKNPKEAKENSGWIDISVEIKSDMVHWPGDPPVIIDRVKDMEKGNKDNVSRISMGSHTGTHMDAPLHFLQKGMSLAKKTRQEN
ncbi:MAG: cyclase family protein [Nitrospirota bacterium]